MTMLIVYSQLYSTCTKGELLFQLFAMAYRTMNTTQHFICHGLVHQRELLFINLEVTFELGFQTHCLQNILGCLVSFLVNCKRMAIFSTGYILVTLSNLGNPKPFHDLVATYHCRLLFLQVPSQTIDYVIVLSSPKFLYEYCECF